MDDYIPPLISSLRNSFEKGDFTHARRDAHTIKGSSSYVNVSLLQQAAYEAEKDAKEENADKLRSMVARKPRSSLRR